MRPFLVSEIERLQMQGIKKAHIPVSSFLLDLIKLSLVPAKRLELLRPKSQPPQGCVSTNSTTSA